MRIFSGWRAVGMAMRWARQQDGVTAPLVVLDKPHSTWLSPDDHRYQAINVLKWMHEDGRSVEIFWRRGDRFDLAVKYPDRDDMSSPFVGMDSTDDARVVLRVLAALDLIPAHLAAAEDERYGRCVKCGGLTHHWDDFGTTRWCHLQPTRPYHVPEVAS